YRVMFCFFFFQAEDGIRDFHVTGVQTCALPILRSVRQASGALRELAKLLPSTATRIVDGGRTEEVPLDALREGDQVLVRPGAKRSEERRVGKEWRSGWSREREERGKREDGRASE